MNMLHLPHNVGQNSKTSWHCSRITYCTQSTTMTLSHSSQCFLWNSVLGGKMSSWNNQNFIVLCLLPCWHDQHHHLKENMLIFKPTLVFSLFVFYYFFNFLPQVLSFIPSALSPLLQFQSFTGFTPFCTHYIYQQQKSLLLTHLKDHP